jgi:hypothetical protein
MWVKKTNKYPPSLQSRNAFAIDDSLRVNKNDGVFLNEWWTKCENFCTFSSCTVPFQALQLPHKSRDLPSQ